MDNYYLNCPAKMEDQGRHVADFRSPTVVNEYIKYVNDITRDDQYRLFLQMNGKEIMDREWAYYNKNSKCWANACIHNYPTRGNARDYAQEKVAFDSIFNPNINSNVAALRQCHPRPDFRLASDQN